MGKRMFGGGRINVGRGRQTEEHVGGKNERQGEKKRKENGGEIEWERNSRWQVGQTESVGEWFGQRFQLGDWERQWVGGKNMRESVQESG